MGETPDEMTRRDNLDLNDIPVESSAIRRKETSAGSGPEATQIRSGIERTRADLSETIGALQEKLDPTRLAEQAKEQIREKAAEAYDTAKNTIKDATLGKAEKIVSSVSETVGDATGRAGSTVKDTGSSIAQYIREYPIPFALIGIGVGVLIFLNKRKTEQWSGEPNRSARFNTDDAYETGNFGDSARNLASGVAGTARGAAERASATVGSATGSVREAVGTAADTTRQQLSNVSGQARQRARAARGRFKNTLRENPMVLGVAAFAAGAIIGLTAPSTRVESEYMGEARDRLLDQAKSTAKETAQKIRHVAAEAGHTVKDAAHREGLIED